METRPLTCINPEEHQMYLRWTVQLLSLGTVFNINSGALVPFLVALFMESNHTYADRFD